MDRNCGVVLLAKGGYGDWPRRELAGMLAAVRATGRYAVVEGAFLDQADGHLPAALEKCLEAGVERILVVPAFVPVDRTLRNWLPKIVRRWTKKRHVGTEVEVILGRALGDHPALGGVVARVAREAEDGEDVRVDAAEKDRADNWVGIPPHRYQALLCAGPQCTTLGANDVWAYLSRQLHQRGLYETERGVISVKTSCLYPCNWGPIMVVQPEECWYGAVNEAAVDEIVEQHFARGVPVSRHLRSRPRVAAPTPNGSRTP